MKIITLLTDFGLKDNFVGVMKGAILSINPKANIVDISHSVNAHNLIQAAFLLKASFKYFPKDTIHVVVIDPGVGSKRKIILVKTKDYYFLAPDNGILSLALEEKEIQNIIRVENQKFFLKTISCTFHGRDIFAPVAAFLSKGIKLSSFGPKVNSMNKLAIPYPRQSNNTLIAQIIHVDRFGNLITNVDRKTLQRFSKKAKIKIKDTFIDGISNSYQDVKKGEPLAIIDSFNYLEIAVNGSSAKRLFSLDKKDKIKIIKS